MASVMAAHGSRASALPLDSSTVKRQSRAATPSSPARGSRCARASTPRELTLLPRRGWRKT
eukprot:scaffold196267_cov32-Tisochrysis_lutea.AAC.7